MTVQQAAHTLGHPNIEPPSDMRILKTIMWLRKRKLWSIALLAI